MTAPSNNSRSTHRTTRRTRKIVAGMLIAAVALVGLGTVAHAFLIEYIVIKIVKGDNPVDGNCEWGPDLVPCSLPTKGTGVPKCEVEITPMGLEGFVPVTASFHVSSPSHNPVTSFSYEYSDGASGKGQSATPYFSRTFGIPEVGHHSVTVKTVHPSVTCTTTLPFYVRPQPWIFITQKADPLDPYRVALHAGGAIDNQPLELVNWTFGGGTPVDCPGWCVSRDVVVSFPGPGAYQVTATAATPVPGGLSRTITVYVGGQASVLPPQEQLEDATVTDLVQPVDPTPPSPSEPEPQVELVVEPAELPLLGEPPVDPNPSLRLLPEVWIVPVDPTPTPPLWNFGLASI
jgi:hypothetical protein